MEGVSKEEQQAISRTLINHGYELLGPVGKGGFASVFKIKSIKYNTNFVVKRVLLNDSPSLREKETDGEIQALQGLMHPFIIKMYEFFKDENALYIVLEYCENGSIVNLIEKGPLNIKQFKAIAKQILEALNFCHSKNIAHRDIKPANILLDSYNRVRLADFGLAHHLSEGAFLNKHSGSLAFMAPEIVKKTEYDPLAADVWALGITFYWMATGEFPFPKNTREELVNSIKLGHIQFPQEFDHKIRQLINMMCKYIPSKRPSVKSILEMDIFTSGDAPTRGISLRSMKSSKTRRLIASTIQMITPKVGNASARGEIHGNCPPVKKLTASEDEGGNATLRGSTLNIFKSFKMSGSHVPRLPKKNCSNPTFSDYQMDDIME
ncbi:CAMK family protein kinase [Tritrichomonas foetus]|uniref:CAMK family protein kinase n=1 Tax=Tritrichomonas foetus TaxID=1144522 RepID=A0A1J4KKK4_9EUKA|nr:CAMK family protein kinase [Tritrichomonas foetus]|eukprot:OHT11823.1 CAMK family protein kinase [Tritrichomonas foetus]